MALLELPLKVLRHLDKVIPLLHQVFDLVLEALDLLRWCRLNLTLRATIAKLLLALSHQFYFLLEHNDLLELTLDHLLELEDLLVSLFASQDDIKLRQSRFILVKLPLHQGIIVHKRLRASHLFKQEIVKARGMILPEHLFSAAFDLEASLGICLWQCVG